jgi:two-component system nitrogen regulation response regulator GlnG/two-component system response regulator HydG
MAKSDLDITMPGIRAPWSVSATTAPAIVPALVIAWSEQQPERIGEVAFLPEDGSARVLGRGPEQDGDPAPRLAFWQQLPGEVRETEPLLGARLSRRQLILRRRDEGIEVERIGACPLLINGSPLDRATLRAGDTIYLKDQLVLLVDERPDRLDTGMAFPPDIVDGFGRADRFGIVGESAAAWKLRTDLAFVGRAAGHALVLGESGVGKELAARAIHGLSLRGQRALVARSAATIPDALMDAEMFGNVGNYPNPGMRERPGLIGEADGSTLFLDEIGELPEALQARLLRVLDSGGEYSRLGESKARRADVRLLAATNRGTDELKADFGARFALRVEVPGLNERRADIPLLVRHLLRRAAETNPAIASRFFPDGKPVASAEPHVAPDLIEQLLRHQYQLHVRELDGLLWKAMLASPDRFVLLTPDVACALETDHMPPTEAGEVSEADVRAALERHEQNVTRAARELGVKNRYVLYRLMKKYGIEG